MAHYANRQDYLSAKQRYELAADRKRQTRMLVNRGITNIDEIANEVGISSGTVRNYINRFGWTTKNGEVQK